MNNGLKQVGTLAPTLFNLDVCLLAERWSARVCDVKGVKTYLTYKFDKKLFRTGGIY